MTMLFPHQISGVEWLRSRKSALLADEMGLGKTAQALSACGALDAILVIAPAVAKSVWEREAKTWAPSHTVTVLSGRGKFRWPAPGEIVVVNYDILPDEIAAPACAVRLIADEAHAVKSAKALRTLYNKVLVKYGIDDVDQNFINLMVKIKYTLDVAKSHAMFGDFVKSNRDFQEAKKLLKRFVECKDCL